MLFVLAPAVLCLLFAVLLIWAEYKKGNEARVLFKTVASMFFLMLGVIAALFAMSSYRLWILAGLACSVFGDVFLAFFDNDQTKAHLFEWGVIAFGCAQVCYSIYFILWGGFSLWSLLITAVIACAALSGIRVFHMDVRGFLPALAVYSALLCFAFANAFMTMLGQLSATDGMPVCSIVAAAGMGLFLLSDLFLLFKYFKPGAPKSLTLFNLSTYYLAQVCLGVSGMLFL